MATKRQASKSAFKPGTSGNPRGKPVGTRSKSTQLLLALMEGDTESITKTVINAAKERPSVLTCPTPAPAKA